MGENDGKMGERLADPPSMRTRAFLVSSRTPRTFSLFSHFFWCCPSALFDARGNPVPGSMLLSQIVPHSSNERCEQFANGSHRPICGLIRFHKISSETNNRFVWDESQRRIQVQKGKKDRQKGERRAYTKLERASRDRLVLSWWIDHNVQYLPGASLLSGMLLLGVRVHDVHVRGCMCVS